MTAREMWKSISDLSSGPSWTEGCPECGTVDTGRFYDAGRECVDCGFYVCPTAEEHDIWRNDQAEEAWSGAYPMRVRDLRELLDRWSNDERDNMIVCFATDASYVDITSISAPCRVADGGCGSFSAVTLWSMGEDGKEVHTEWRDV
jgi:hypothetical protein